MPVGERGGIITNLGTIENNYFLIFNWMFASICAYTLYVGLLSQLKEMLDEKCDFPLQVTRRVFDSVHQWY